ncbi:MAG: D-glycero-beta-D-manno-heptose-7-phosphate kinase [Candidatus Eisenbacteria bacterium]|nr:D-glycero-beta-D-manno-heptose-7-phosphate kinase [Candidatus Eisenbacteria bacterium]
MNEKRLKELLKGMRGRRILVLGDIMLDKYLWGTVWRISPEAPVPVVDVLSESYRLGGAGNVAQNIRSLGGKPFLATVIGNDLNGRILTKELGRQGISSSGILAEKGRVTTLKTRIIAHNQQVVRADQETREGPKAEVARKLLSGIRSEIGRFDACVISDYGKGVITPSLLKNFLLLARKMRVPVFVDPKESHFPSYRGVSLITPNQIEASTAFGKKIVDEASLREVGSGLRRRLGCEAVLITRGDKGMTLFEKNGSVTHFPTVARHVYDVTGAGDTVVSAFALAVSAGGDFREAAEISNHAAGLVIRELGTAATTREEIYASFREDLNPENLKGTGGKK